MAPPKQSVEDLVSIVRDMYTKTDESIKDLTKRIDGFRDEQRDRLDRLREEYTREVASIRRDYESKIQNNRESFDAKFEKASTDLTVLKTEGKSYTRSWGTVVGIVSAVISGLIMFLLTRGFGK